MMNDEYDDPHELEYEDLPEPGDALTPPLAQTEYPSAEHASTNFYWTYGKQEVFNLQTTLRGFLSRTQVDMHLAMVRNALKMVVEGHGHAKQVGQSSSPAVTAIAPAAAAVPSAPVTPGTLPPGVPAAPSAPAAPVQAQGGVVHYINATSLEISLRTDGKIDAKWFEQNMRYPAITSTRTAAMLANMLAPTGGWTVEEHFSKPNTYPVKHRIGWTPSSKTNTKGNPYKDIVSIEVY